MWQEPRACHAGFRRALEASTVEAGPPTLKIEMVAMLRMSDREISVLCAKPAQMNLEDTCIDIF